MPQPKKSQGRSQSPAGGDAASSTLAAISELVARSLMLPSDRLRDTLDDAVKRGRITRADAEELIERLMTLGRQQSDDALSRLDTALGGGAGAKASSGGAKDKARSVVRRPPGADRV
ncbi:MAG TPA: hypothetical protein VGW10_14445, partial [Solirubrobacteraceae bacterium]|nr:hypothetical protein [Solirubrobacteraceae bacterium]